MMMMMMIAARAEKYARQERRIGISAFAVAAEGAPKSVFVPYPSFRTWAYQWGPGCVAC